MDELLNEGQCDLQDNAKAFIRYEPKRQFVSIQNMFETHE